MEESDSSMPEVRTRRFGAARPGQGRALIHGASCKMVSKASGKRGRNVGLEVQGQVIWRTARLEHL